MRMHWRFLEIVVSGLLVVFLLAFQPLVYAADTTPPAVTGMNPANNAVNVALNAPVIITYDENIQAGWGFKDLRVVSETYTGPYHSTMYLKEVSGNKIFISRADGWVGSTSYKVIVPPGVVEDMAGNRSKNGFVLHFTTTAPPDTSPPYVTGTSPVDNATKVAINSAITITYSENIQAGSNISGVTVRNNASGQNVTINSPQVSGKKLTITVYGAWNRSTSYTVTVPLGAIKDMAGNQTTSVNIFSFTTTATQVTGAPPAITGANSEAPRPRR